MFRRTLVLAATALAASAASAGVIHVSPIGGGINLNSGPAPAFGFGPTLNSSALVTLHDQLNADGIATDGRVTFAAVDTDSGLAMIALVDRVTLTSSPSPSGLHMDTASDAASIGLTSDAGIFVFNSGPTDIGFGDFAWDSNGGGDGFAWTNLSNGTALTWRFQINGPLGLIQPNTFQFVNWNGSDWDLIAAGTASFSPNNEFAFAANVVPAPASAVLALAGLGAFTRRRR